LSTGQFTGIGRTQFLVGIARSGSTIYGIDAQSNLVSIDPATAATTIIGNTGVTSPPGPYGLVVDVFSSLSDGRLFLMDYQNNLFSVNPSTGRATLVGSTGIRPIKEFFLATSLAGDSSTLYFTVHEVSKENFRVVTPPSLYRIDPSTAAATKVGPTPNFVFGSVYARGTLYGFTRGADSSGTERNLIISLNTMSGGSIAAWKQPYMVTNLIEDIIDILARHGILAAIEAPSTIQTGIDGRAGSHVPPTF
jgi:hypothetical protein